MSEQCWVLTLITEYFILNYSEKRWVSREEAIRLAESKQLRALVVPTKSAHFFVHSLTNLLLEICFVKIMKIRLFLLIALICILVLGFWRTIFRP